MSAQQSNSVVHPLTGEILDNLAQQPPETLAGVLTTVRGEQAALKDFTLQLESELQRRLELRGRKVAVFGKWEVAVEGGRESVWDPDDTEATLRELVDQGAVEARELGGVIRRETVVSRTEVNKVLGRLSGSARDALEACRVWRDKGRPRIRVTRSVELINAESENQ